MALTIRVAANDADLTAISTLFTTKVAGQSIVDEFNADFGTTVPMTLAVWHPKLVDKNTRILMGFQPAGTLRGACYWTNEQGVWTCRMVGIDKSLTATARLSGARDFFIECANRVPPATIVTGVMKQNGKLHTWLSPQLPASDFSLSGTMITVTTTAQRLAGIQ